MFEFIKGKEKKCEESIKKIKEIENKYGILFPDKLVEFYSLYDGEKIDLRKFEVNGFECEVVKIVPIIADKMFFESIVESDRADGFIPKDYFPLARDRGGNFYYWKSETYEVFLVFCDDYENPYKVADTVNDFFLKLND